MTLEQVEAIGPGQAIPEDELLAVIQYVYSRHRGDLDRAEFEGPWTRELERIVSVYFGWVGRLLSGDTQWELRISSPRDRGKEQP